MQIRACAALFATIFAIYLSNLYFDYKSDQSSVSYRSLSTSLDSIPNTFLPYVILQKGVLYFDDIKQDLRNRLATKDESPYYFIKSQGHYYSVYPIATGIAALPFYVIPISFGLIPSLNLHEYFLRVLILGRVAASFYAAATSVLVFLCLEKISTDRRWNIIYTFFFALGTCTFAISSRTLWQHTFSEFLVAALVLILLTNQNPFATGGILGLLVLTRPTNILVAIAISLFFLLRKRKDLPKLIIGALPLAVLFFLYNRLAYGSFFSEGYSARDAVHWGNPLEGILGLLVSPSRSFLFVSPPLALSFLAIFWCFKNKGFGGRNNTIYRYLSLGYMAAFLFFSQWGGWGGANGFGYRMLVDFLPIVTILFFEVARKFTRVGKTVVIVLMIYSILIQANAVVNLLSRCSATYNWSFRCLSPFKLTSYTSAEIIRK